MKRFFSLVALTSALCIGVHAADASRPNVLFVIADDWGPHAGAYQTGWVKTPAFDRIAKEGLLFQNAYTPQAKCAPSRACVLTGRYPWQNEEAGNHLSFFPTTFKSWPEVLMQKGWHTGITGKGWGPGIANDTEGKTRLITGKPYDDRKTKPPTRGISSNDYAANFIDFLDAAPNQTPWSFWVGIQEPHRVYEYQSGVKKGGKKLSDIDRIPSYWPDVETVRHDMLDYALEIEYLDSQLGRIVAELKKRGQLDNTLIIVTSDHGMPFPRVKGYAYPASNQVPLAIRWPRGVKSPGRTISDFVDFTDIAKTILDFAAIPENESGMKTISGKSWRPILESSKSGQVLPERDHVIIGKERNDIARPNNWGYPIRGILTAGSLYLHNYEPSRWPAGNPEIGYLETDGGATKSYILELGRADRANPFWKINFGMRPAEEFYQLADDRDCMKNLAKDPTQAERVHAARSRMETELKAQGDPRMDGRGDIFDKYPPSEGDGLHEKFMRGEKVQTGWIEPTDFEKEPIDPSKL